MAKFRTYRRVTKIECFEFEAANETAAKAAIHQLNARIADGFGYDPETDLDKCSYVGQTDTYDNNSCFNNNFYLKER